MVSSSNFLLRASVICMSLRWRWSSGSEKRSSCMSSSSVRKERALYATAATTATSDTLSVLCARNNF